MNFLTQVSGGNSTSLSASMRSSAAMRQRGAIEERILMCNPILEAFGNAKTVRNDNSSRFGKYVRIWLQKNASNAQGRILGATINKYLLEKSRVTQVSEQERNYHIFYHFLCGHSNLQSLRLEADERKYRYLSSTTQCFRVEGLDDKRHFELVQASFKQIGFIDQEVQAIFSILASILHLGNLDFDARTLTDNNPCSVKDQHCLESIASLLGVGAASLLQALTVKLRVVGKSTIHSPLKVKECETLRDSLSRGII